MDNGRDADSDPDPDRDRPRKYFIFWFWFRQEVKNKIQLFQSCQTTSNKNSENHEVKAV